MKDITSEVRELRHHLAALIAQRDELVFHVCPMLKNEYYRKTGNLEIRIQNRRYEIACLKRGVPAERESLIEEHSVREDYPLTDENTDASLTQGYLVLVERLDPAVNVNGNEALLTVTYWNAWSGLVKMSVKAHKKGSGIAFEEPVKEVLVPYKTGIRF